MPCHGWLAFERSDHLSGLGCGVARNRTEHSISSGLPAAAFPLGNQSRRFRVFVIGIDPHKGSHTAAVLDEREMLLSDVRVRASRRQCDELLGFAQRFEPRCWALEGATGTGALLAQQLVAAGEVVLDVPPTLSARVRLLADAKIDKTDAHDARSAAVVALRHSRLRTVVREDHTAQLPAREATPRSRRPSHSGGLSPPHRLVFAGCWRPATAAVSSTSRCRAASDPTRRSDRLRTSTPRPRPPDRASPRGS